MPAPHTLAAFERLAFERLAFERLAFEQWLDANHATIIDTTNPFEVLRYRKWCDGDSARPSTHIIYARGDGTLTYTGRSRQHYEEFSRDC